MASWACWVACLPRCSLATAFAEDAFAAAVEDAVVVVAAVVMVGAVAVEVVVGMKSWTVAFPFAVVAADVAWLAACLCYPWGYY